ncbi:Beta-galactosidase C-terminal domain [Subtercola sp. RTI3]|uniref:Beta-galactosidase C-terminal domain n=1 Tax=Subtercola sp. RTI3 TaxID=3048639 RepID=UPI002B23DA83|nr:Beta-galactosidase C-terminal domain [Subtercola sp. RTI3]
MFGKGVARYLATSLDSIALAEELHRAVSESGAVAVAPVTSGVEVVRRSGAEHDYVFVINHTNADVEHSIAGYDLVTEIDIVTRGVVASGGVQIVRQKKETS